MPIFSEAIGLQEQSLWRNPTLSTFSISILISRVCRTIKVQYFDVKSFD